MPKFKVTFEPAGVTVEVDPAELPPDRIGRRGSLLDIALASGIEIEHACGGTGVCGTCHVTIERGMQNLSAPQDEELDVVDSVPGSTLNSRLACQAVVKGDVVVRIAGK